MKKKIPPKSYVFFCEDFEKSYKTSVPPFENPQDFFFKNFLVNFFASTVWKALLFVNTSAYYLYSSGLWKKGWQQFTT